MKPRLMVRIVLDAPAACTTMAPTELFVTLYNFVLDGFTYTETAFAGMLNEPKT